MIAPVPSGEKYGLLMARGAKEQHFRLDTDRFVEGPVNSPKATTRRLLTPRM
jgi:hypothetical protein